MAVFEDLGKPWKFSDLGESLRRTLDQIQAGEPITWDGPETTWCQLEPGVPGCFETDSLEDHEDRGRDAIDVLLMAALQIGMEQGARIVAWDLPFRDLRRRLERTDERARDD